MNVSWLQEGKADSRKAIYMEKVARNDMPDLNFGLHCDPNRSRVAALARPPTAKAGLSYF